MARKKDTGWKFTKGIITWTRFYLPETQEWPMWSSDYSNIYIGPLSNVPGCRLMDVFVGRMVDHPTRAAYVIDWETLEDLETFQSSPACAEFLQMLPEYDVDNSDVSIDSGFTLRRLALDDASSSSSRFLALNYVSEVSTPTVEGRVTFTSLLVPGKVEERAMWRESLSCFQTPDPLWSNSSELWFWVLMEDDSMQEKFGKLEQSQQTQGESQARTIFCHFTVWRYTNADPEEEGAIAADPQAWKEELDGVMPPVTAWHQERWDFRPVPELR